VTGSPCADDVPEGKSDLGGRGRPADRRVRSGTVAGGTRSLRYESVASGCFRAIDVAAAVDSGQAPGSCGMRTRRWNSA
jgi:hypothetical protein